MVRVVRVFIGHDRKSQMLVDLFKSLVDASDSEFRLDIYYINTEEQEIKDFIELSYDIFGGVFIHPLFEYSISLLPTILIGKNKIIEGKFPNLDEIMNILEKCGVYIDRETLKNLANEYLKVLKIGELKYKEELVGIDKCIKCFFYSYKVNFCLRYMSDVKIAIINCDLKPHSQR